MTDMTTEPYEWLSAHLADKMTHVDHEIALRFKSQAAPRIDAIGAHLISAGGKRLRPLLTIAAAQSLGYQGQSDVLLATAVEYIHTATLLHDDVIDESDQRRGRPTANRLWDNTSSVLVGDYLFSRAFQLMVETKNLQVLDILSAASCTISEGEVLQMTAARDLATDEAIYYRVIRGKTAALFSAATQAGAVLATSDQMAQQALFDYGDALGISFQVVDDLLDVTGDSAKTGKNIGDDFRERKLTLPMIKAIAANPDARPFWQRTIEKGEQTEGDLEYALSQMTTTGAIAEARRDAQDWADRAKAALAPLPDTPIKMALGHLADFVVARVV